MESRPSEPRPLKTTPPAPSVTTTQLGPLARRWLTASLALATSLTTHPVSTSAWGEATHTCQLGDTPPGPHADMYLCLVENQDVSVLEEFISEGSSRSSVEDGHSCTEYTHTWDIFLVTTIILYYHGVPLPTAVYHGILPICTMVYQYIPLPAVVYQYIPWCTTTYCSVLNAYHCALWLVEEPPGKSLVEPPADKQRPLTQL